MRRTGTTLVCLLAIAGIAAPAASAAPTRAEYIAQADPICRAASKQFTPVARAFNRKVRKGAYRAAAAKWGRLVKIYARETRELATLEPPAADAQLIGRWIAGLRSQTPMAKRVRKPIRAGKLKLAQKRLNRLQKRSARTKALVADYGFRHCDTA